MVEFALQKVEILKMICIAPRWVNKDAISLSHSPCILSSFMSGQNLVLQHFVRSTEEKEFHYILMATFCSLYLWVFVNLCHSSFTEPVKSYVPRNERCALWVLSQEHHPLYHDVVLGHNCGQDGAQSYWFQCPCNPGVAFRVWKRWKRQSRKISFHFLVKEHSVCFCAVWFWWLLTHEERP